MKKLVIAGVLAALAFGSMLGPASAEQLTKAERMKRILLGAKLWGIYCNQCHNARPPSEKAPWEWDAEIIHMGTLGNFPAQDRRALVEYLKAR